MATSASSSFYMPDASELLMHAETTTTDTTEDSIYAETTTDETLNCLATNWAPVTPTPAHDHISPNILGYYPANTTDMMHTIMADTGASSVPTIEALSPIDGDESDFGDG